MSLNEIFGEPISVYSRQQAIEDGVLVDVSQLAKEAGWKWPVAITQALHADLANIPKQFSHEDYTGRLWDVLWMGMLAAKQSRGAVIAFDLILHTQDNGTEGEYSVKAVCGPGDNGEPVITIMLPHED